MELLSTRITLMIVGSQNHIYHTAQSSYLSFLEFTNSTATSGTLLPCQNCTGAVPVPDNGFPFGSYYHSTIYVSYCVFTHTTLCGERQDATTAYFMSNGGDTITIFTKL